MKLLSELEKIVEKKAKRKGRGLSSGKGAKSGRGTTRHQKARTNIPLHFEGGQARLVKKYPLLRGKGRNKPRVTKKTVIKLSTLNLFANGETVDMDTLVKKNILTKPVEIKSLKILAQGKLAKKITVKLPTSKAAKKSIEKIGGKVEQI